jgi:hypothetical protein
MDLVKRATVLLESCSRRDFTAAYAHASQVLLSAVPEFLLAETWTRAVRTAGELKAIESSRVYRHLLAPLAAVVVVCRFERMVVEAHFGFDQSGQILGLTLLTPGLE